MPGTDRNLLRLAVYEMRFLDGDEAIDDAVVINEAVEISKAYGTDESSRFVNGVLGRIARMDQLPEPPQDETDEVELDDEEADALSNDDEALEFAQSECEDVPLASEGE